MLKWINLFLINLLFFLYKFIWHYIVIFFLRKKIKKVSSKYLNLNLNIKNGVYLENIYLDKIKINYIHLITCNLYSVLYKKFFLHIFDKLFITFNDNLYIENENNISDKIDIKFVNLENLINDGLNNIQKILNYLLLSHKFIVKNLTVDYNIYKFYINNLIIVKKKKL